MNSRRKIIVYKSFLRKRIGADDRRHSVLAIAALSVVRRRRNGIMNGCDKRHTLETYVGDYTRTDIGVSEAFHTFAQDREVRFLLVLYAKSVRIPVVRGICRFDG